MPVLPLVSIIIPTYNQAAYLPAALDSALQQTYSSIEIIVIDDGSSDMTDAIGKLYKLKDPRIHWIEQSNQGAAAARNRGIALAQGEYICLLDSDDLMHKERIAKQYAVFQSHPSVDIVHTAVEVINSKGEHLCQMRGENVSPPDFLALMFFRNQLPTSSVIMAKSHCLKEHPYNPTIRHAEDYELMLHLAHLFHFYYLDLPLTCYRRHSTNLSNRLDAHHASERNILQQYDRSHIDQIVDQTTFSDQEKSLLKGRVLFNRGNDEEALSFFKQLSSALAFFYQGNCLLRLQRLDQAMIAYQQSLQIDRSNPACYNNLGVAYAIQGKIDEAKECFQKALALNQGYLDAGFNLQHAGDQWRMTWRELRTTLLPYQSNY